MDDGNFMPSPEKTEYLPSEVKCPKQPQLQEQLSSTLVLQQTRGQLTLGTLQEEISASSCCGDRSLPCRVQGKSSSAAQPLHSRRRGQLLIHPLHPNSSISCLSCPPRGQQWELHQLELLWNKLSLGRHKGKQEGWKGRSSIYPFCMEEHRKCTSSVDKSGHC